MIRHVLSFSGGKDSTALYLLAREMRDRIERRGHTIEVVFADTGHEHPLTYDFTRELPLRFDDGFPIRWVKADFTADFERKRAFMAEHWPKNGVPQDRVDRALELLRPTGIPFLDLCMFKGRFPSTRRRFCSEETKHKPIFEQVVRPALLTGADVWSWQGVRADESASRASLPRADLALTLGSAELWNIRPLHRWTAEQVFAIHRRHGVSPNPLYLMGMGRVGCMPCIHCTKDELREIAKRFPEEIARIAEWETLVSEVSKRGVSTFFSYDKVPGHHQEDKTLPMPRVDEVVAWSFTERGGRSYSILSGAPASVCSSLYGLCE